MGQCDAWSVLTEKESGADKEGAVVGFILARRCMPRNMQNDEGKGGAAGDASHDAGQDGELQERTSFPGDIRW